MSFSQTLASDTCYLKSFGKNRVAENEGNDIGSKYGITIEECKTSCKQNNDCQSFAYCPTDKSCWLKDRLLKSSEMTKPSVCTSYFHTCGKFLKSPVYETERII